MGRRRRDSDGAGATEKRRHRVPRSQSFSSLLFLQCLASGSILTQAKGHWYCVCAHGSTPQPPQLCRTLDAHHRSARSGSQGIKSSCSSAALMHTPAPGHACTLKGCHFSTHHLSSKSWTVKSIRVLQVIVLPNIHELSSEQHSEKRHKVRHWVHSVSDRLIEGFKAIRHKLKSP